MFANTPTKETKASRRYQKEAAFAVLGLLVGGGLIYGIKHLAPSLYEAVPVDVAIEEPVASAYALPESLPTLLRIPKINVSAPFEAPLGIDEKREIEIPKEYTTVGWYKYGPTPGELGPSVVLGHVDSYKGPAVLYSLGKLEVGDEIFIDREDGTTAIFEVVEMERELQSEFPTRKVYGDLPYAGLRLITCTGVYDHGKLRYSHNLIVYAKLKEPAESAL